MLETIQINFQLYVIRELKFACKVPALEHGFPVGQV